MTQKATDTSQVMIPVWRSTQRRFRLYKDMIRRNSADNISDNAVLIDLLDKAGVPVPADEGEPTPC